MSDVIPAQVQAGAKFLDRKLGPGWVEQINLDTLDIDSGCHCIAAQLVDGEEGVWMNAWENAMYVWGIYPDGDPRDFEDVEELPPNAADRAVELGFLARVSGQSEDFEDGWRALIAERIAERAS